MGLSPSVYLALTLREAANLWDAWRERDRRERIRFADLALIVAAAGGLKRKDKRPLTRADLLGEDEQTRQQSPAEMRAKLAQFFGAKGARNARRRKD